MRRAQFKAEMERQLGPMAREERRERRLAAAVVPALKTIVAECGYSSVYFAQSLGRYVAARRYLTGSELEMVLAAAARAGLHVEKFCDKDLDPFVWITDQSHGAVAAVPPWAASRGWGEDRRAL